MIYPNLPEKALSIMQPWAWLIVNRHKAIENRDWITKYRGPVCIHAGKTVDASCHRALLEGFHPVSYDAFDVRDSLSFSLERGGIVGVADVVDCVVESGSDWFVGRYGFVLANQRPVPFIPVKGALSFFDWRKNL